MILFLCGLFGFGLGFALGGTKHPLCVFMWHDWQQNRGLRATDLGWQQPAKLSRTCRRCGKHQTFEQASWFSIWKGMI